MKGKAILITHFEECKAFDEAMFKSELEKYKVFSKNLVKESNMTFAEDGK